MKKVFEALERLAMPDDLHKKECEKLGISLTEDYELVLSTINELEQIKNSKPCDEVIQKEFDALKRIRQETAPATYNPDFDKLECCDILYQALTELKAIKEQRIEYMSGRLPDKGIYELKRSLCCSNQTIYYASKTFGNKYIVPREEYEALKKKCTEYENKLKCIDEKNVDMKFLRECDTVEEYNKYCDDITDEKPLTEDEFISLKG